MNNQTILLIDYDPASISKTATPLTKAGYQVEVAKDGLSGLAAFERMKPALVLVEAMLPRKHGFEVCQEIKAKPEGKSTPVLITTAVCRGRKYRMDALQIYGCDEYIEKPITDDELLKMIQRFVQQASEAREQVQQDLSEAIDEAAPDGDTPDRGTSDVPVAIETMADDELEAKIDALLEGGNPIDEGEEILAPASLQEAPTPVAASAVATVAPTVDAAPTNEGDETDQQLDALFPSAPASIDQPAIEVEAIPVETAPPAESATAEEPAAVPAPEMPNLDTDTDWFAPQPEAEAEPASPEPVQAEPVAAPVPELALEPPPAPAVVETAKPKKGGGSKAVLIGVAAVIVLGVVGLLAFQQGWIGGEGAAELVADNAPQAAAPSTTPGPQVYTPPIDTPTEQSPDPASRGTEIAAQIEPEPAAPVEAQPQPSEPKPELPPKPQAFTGRSKAERDAARKRQRQADRALNRAAGSLQSQLLAANEEPETAAAETVAPIDVNDEITLGEPVRPKAQRGELYPLSAVDESPVHVRFEQPEYDDIARRMNQEGVVVVDVLIDETGTVTETRLIQKIPNSRLNDATLRAARRWTYKPAIKDGVPVMVWKSERIAFELE